jgi:hypothetical protein
MQVQDAGLACHQARNVGLGGRWVYFVERRLATDDR